MPSATYSARYNAALNLAATAHRGQTRKGSDTPFITHPLHVSALLIRHGFDEDVAIAGLLHDVVEDSETTLEEIEQQFGPAVTAMVGALTERKRMAGVELAWEIRKREALERLRVACTGAAAVKAADVVHNALTLSSQLHHEGAACWRFYRRGAGQTLWYYRAVATIVTDKLGPHPITVELERALQELEQVADGAGDG